MKLILALGNPGKQYDRTRHNIGFSLLDSFANKATLAFVLKSKFNAEVAELNLNGEKVIFAKPQTFYNEVGISYQSLRAYYSIEARDTLVIHDELALPLGTIRVRQGGSDAGNNGVKSINTHGGDQSYRLRLGVASDQRSLIGDTDFVLGRFTAQESEFIHTHITATAHAIIDQFINGSLEAHSVTHGAAEAADPE